MKATKLVIKNIGIIASEEIVIDKPLLIFYGSIRQGKSTLLKAVQWVCGGAFPSDIIKHGEKEASIELHFVGGYISRSLYKNAKGETESRPIHFIKDGKPVSKPVSEIQRLMNPFLTDQEFLVKKGETDRKRFFTDLFGVDTTELDIENTRLSNEASSLRSEIKGYGEIDLTEFKPVDTTALKAQRQAKVDDVASARAALEAELATINQAYEKQVEGWATDSAALDIHNATVERGNANLVDLNTQIGELEKKLAELNTKKTKTTEWLYANLVKMKAAKPPTPDTAKLKADIHKLHTADTAAIDQQIQDAGATNARAETYQKNLARSQELTTKQTTLRSKEDRQRTIKAEKVAKLKDISEKSGIEGLEFDEDGNFSYEGTSAGMLSTSQMLKLSSELSSLYPDGIGLELLDRAESLGKSIFEFVDRAKKENKTILATVVGERPATVPENVGVFVVDNGRIS